MRYLIGPEGKRQHEREPEGVPIVVDVLRASSTIVAALWAGAKEVIPVEDEAEALSLGRILGAVLVGERGGRKLEGFDYNNSPSEMLTASLKGRTVVITTSHGTKVMAEGGIVGSTLNAGAVAEHTMSMDRIYLLASDPGVSEEDLDASSLIEVMAVMLGRGYFMYQVEQFIQNDEECQEMLDCIRHTPAGEKVARLGYREDVDLICRDVNRFPIVPVYRDGSIKVERSSLAE
jgi:2-phosphosulfolactate phosphatase